MMVFLKIDTINNFQDLNLKYYDYYYCLYFDNFDMQKIDSFDFIMNYENYYKIIDNIFKICIIYCLTFCSRFLTYIYNR